jgi:hypothetical protein
MVDEDVKIDVEAQSATDCSSDCAMRFSLHSRPEFSDAEEPQKRSVNARL